MKAAFVILMILAAAAFAGDNKWTSNGPFGGLIAGFTFHPQVNGVVFASGGGSLFRSRNGGGTWERLELSGAGQFPGAFAVRIHPRNPSTIFAASYSVFTSTNLGGTWQETSTVSRLNGDHYMDMEFDPANPLILYGVTYRSGVFKSTDGGKTWVAKNTGLKLTPVKPCCDATQVEVDPKNGNIVYVSLASRLLYKSTNGGDSWLQLRNGIDPHVGQTFLTIDPGNSQTIYAGGDRTYRSTNGGMQWSLIYDRAGRMLAVDPRNSRVLFFASGSLLKSTDSGATWTALLPGGSGGFLGVAVHPRLNLVFAGGFGSGIFRSQNGGASWQFANNGIDDFNVGQVKSHPQRSTQIFAVASPQLSQSADGGSHWGLVSSLSQFWIMDFEIHPANPNLMVVVGDPPTVGVSPDGGKTWAFRNPNLDAWGEFIALDSNNENNIFVTLRAMASNAPLGISKSTDQGKTWKLVNSGLSDKSISVLAADPKNGSSLFVGTASGKIFKSVNGGGSWKNSSGGLPVSCCIRSIAVDPGNISIVYAVAAGNLYRSTNGGAQWSLKNKGLEGKGIVYSVSVDPRNSAILYAGTFGAMFLSTDRAESWSAFDSTGLGPFQVNEVLINPAQSDIFIAGTARGVYQYTVQGSGPAGPVIEQISPSAGRAGDTITINGRNFGPTQGNSTVVFAGGSAGSAQSWTDTRIQVKAPNGVSTGPVTVTVAGKKSNSFEFTTLPSSGNVQPTSGSSSGGTRVTILGPSGISGTQFNVLFGSTVARDIRFTVPNIITCTTPPGSGTVDVSVTSSAVVAKVGTFTYQ
jgi:photosystem II stability/assembly factor-like uncharacterized protein